MLFQHSFVSTSSGPPHCVEDSYSYCTEPLLQELTREGEDLPQNNHISAVKLVWPNSKAINILDHDKEAMIYLIAGINDSTRKDKYINVSHSDQHPNPIRRDIMY